MKWDQLLPYIVSAYREVPQASIDFSFFELTSVRDVSAPLDTLKEALTEDTTEGDNITTYVNRVYERLEMTKVIGQENLEKAQHKQKKMVQPNSQRVRLGRRQWSPCITQQNGQTIS